MNKRMTDQTYTLESSFWKGSKAWTGLEEIIARKTS